MKREEHYFYLYFMEYLDINEKRQTTCELVIFFSFAAF